MLDFKVGAEVEIIYGSKTGKKAVVKAKHKNVDMYEILIEDEYERVNYYGFELTPVKQSRDEKLQSIQAKLAENQAERLRLLKEFDKTKLPESAEEIQAQYVGVGDLVWDKNLYRCIFDIVAMINNEVKIGVKNSTGVKRYIQYKDNDLVPVKKREGA